MMMTGAEMVIRALELEGVDTIFGIPGGSSITLYDALGKSSIRHILTRHEQAAAHAADGYARACGRVGVCFATSGPGATNLVTGLTTAYMDSSPVVAITGQVSLDLIGRDAFQEADIFGITIGVTKHNYLVRTIEELPRVIKEAFYIANTGRRGPVLVDVPRDILKKTGTFCYPTEVSLPGYRPKKVPDEASLSRVAEFIRLARKPVIVAGGGVSASGASAELTTLAEMCQIPVVFTLMGLGNMHPDHPLSFGMLGMHGLYAANKAVSSCDLLVVLGARFGDRAFGVLSNNENKAKLVHIDIDPAELDKNIRMSVSIAGDARDVLSRLCQLLGSSPPAPKQTDTWLAQLRRWRNAKPLHYSRDDTGTLKPQTVIEHIWEAAGNSGIVTTEVGQHQMWAALYSRALDPRNFITSGGLGTMGFGFPAALGAKVARPDAPVLVIAGDGSIQMNIQELATAVQHDIAVVVCVINNGVLGMVRQWQELFFERNYVATTLGPIPDFAKIAEAYGLPGRRITKEADVVPALKEALASNKTCVLDFLVTPEENVFPMMMNGSVIEQPRPRKQ